MTPRTRRFPKRLVVTIMVLAGTGLCGAVLSLAGLYLYLDPQVPAARTYRNVELETPLRVYSADGALIAEYGERRLIPISLNQVPADFVNAILNTEDKRFFEHSGIDFISLINDTVQLLIYQEIRGGASTITMQLARNVSFSLEQTIIRKLKEMLLALKLERELSKEEILELYINVVPFGKGAYGAEAGAQTYYGKSLGDLDLAQLAMLAGIPKAPTAGNPINGPARALDRRNLVLMRMLEQASIDDAQYRAAVDAPITARLFARPLDVPAPYPAELIRQQLSTRYDDLYKAGYEVVTTIDSRLQAAAEKAVREGLLAYDRRHGYRGPEFTVVPDNPDDAYPEYLAALSEMTPIGGLVPAVVVAVDETTFDALIPSNIVLQLPFESMAWARRYISEDRRDAAPEKPADVVAVGDVVRLRHEISIDPETNVSEDSWSFSQVPDVQGALVALEPNSGAVLAMVGGFDFGANQFNNATQAARQPGSGFKPFVYSAAIDSGITPASLFLDAPLVFEDNLLETEYRPRNDNARFNGETRLREALYRSINLVSIRVLQEVSAGRVLNFARNALGFDIATFPRNTQLAIGGGTMEVTPIDMAKSYALFANGGFQVTPHLLTSVRDRRDKEIYREVYPRVCRDCDPAAEAADESGDAVSPEPASDGSDSALPEDPASTQMATSELPAPNAAGDQAEIIEHPPAEQTLDARNAYIMHTMLQDVIRRGTGTKARVLERTDIGGKTGTTDEAADTWFNGYMPELVATAWVGFADYRPLGRREYGSTAPLPIWIDFMRDALADRPEVFLPQPPGIVTMKVDRETGEPTVPSDPDGIFEYFLSEHAPPARSAPSRQEENVYDLIDEDEAVLPEELF